MYDVVRLVGHGHVPRVESSVGNKGGVGRVLERLHLQLSLLSLLLEPHTPVLEPCLHLFSREGERGGGGKAEGEKGRGREEEGGEEGGGGEREGGRGRERGIEEGRRGERERERQERGGRERGT